MQDHDIHRLIKKIDAMARRVEALTDADSRLLLTQYHSAEPEISDTGFLDFLKACAVIDTPLHKQLNQELSEGRFEEGSLRAGMIDAETVIMDTSSAHSMGSDETVLMDVSAHDPDATVLEAPDLEDLDATVLEAPDAAMSESDATVLEDPNATVLVRADLADDTVLETASDDPKTDPDKAHVTHYELLGFLNRGAMGELHVARDVKLQRTVAFKKILPKVASASEVRTLFFNEAQLTAQLDHPNIVPIYGLESASDGVPAYTMKLIDGMDFSAYLKEAEKFQKEKSIPASHELEHRLELFLKVCDAIHFAHDRGVVHRDLKPANIMIGPFNEVYVMDWGIAHLMAEEKEKKKELKEALKATRVILMDLDGAGATIIKEGTLVGTPRYMSPEQAEGEQANLDGLSDLYSLGLILQELVTLKPAVKGEGGVETLLEAAKTGKRQPIARRGVDFELVAIIDKATRLEREDRYPSVKAFAEDIRRYLKGDAVLAKPDNLFRKTARWIAKNRSKALTTMLFLLLAGGFTAFALYQQILLKEAQRHEVLQSNFISRVALHTLSVEKELQRYAGLLEYLAGSAQTLLDHASPISEELHPPSAFDPKAENPPPDLRHAPYYKKPVSFLWPVYKMDHSSASVSVKQLGWLRDAFRRMMLSSVHRRMRHLSEEEAFEIIAKKGAPIHQFFVTLDNGLHVGYPGMSGEIHDYDGRKHPHYARSRSESDIQWGKPYLNDLQHHLVIPASIALTSSLDKFQGVVSFEITLKYIIDHFLGIPELDYLLESMIVDSKGHILAHKGHSELDAANLEQFKEIPLQRFPHSQLIPRFQKEEAGAMSLMHHGRSLLIVFERLDTADWVFVAIGDQNQMMKGE
ncbi:protein kinase domain-containing protein [Magnetococcales bacterium HHB-1]